MKKRALTLLLALVMCLSLSLCTVAMAAEPARAITESPGIIRLSDGTQLVSTKTQYFFIDSKLMNQQTRSNSGYLYSYYKYVTRKNETLDSLPYERETLIASLAAGTELFVDYTFTNSGSITFKGSLEYDLKQAVSAAVEGSTSYTVTVTEQISRTFKNYDSLGRTAEFYAAVGYNLVKFTFEKIDVYIGDGAGGGLGVGRKEVSAGTLYPLAHIPKYYEFRVFSTY